MSKAILNEDRIVTLTTDPAGTEIGNLPANTGLDELRFDGTSLITISDTTAVTSMYVHETADEGFILHIITGTGWQNVSMTWDDRNILINDAGTIRVKTPAELLYETNALSFDSGMIQSENIVERQIDYTRKIPTDIIITDKKKTDPNDLAILFNDNLNDYITYDSTADLTFDTTSGTNFFVQYKFPSERILNNIYLYGDYDYNYTYYPATNTKKYEMGRVFFSYSLNGQDWTYLSYNDDIGRRAQEPCYDATSSDYNLVEYDNIEDARQYAPWIYGTDYFTLDRGVSAKYFRLHFGQVEKFQETCYDGTTATVTYILEYNQHNADLSELRFDDVVKGSVISVESIPDNRLVPGGFSSSAISTASAIGFNNAAWTTISSFGSSVNIATNFKVECRWITNGQAEVRLIDGDSNVLDYAAIAQAGSVTLLSKDSLAAGVSITTISQIKTAVGAGINYDMRLRSTRDKA